MRYPDPPLSIRVAARARRAEEALAREGEHALLTLAALSDAVMTTNLVGSITFMNPAAERLSGWNASDALGRPLETVLPLARETAGEMPDSLPALCLREGRTIERADDVVLQRRDGTEPSVTESASPLFDADGRAIGVALVLRLLPAADRACYAARKAGGGRFGLAPDDAPPPEQSPSLNGARAPLAATP